MYCTVPLGAAEDLLDFSTPSIGLDVLIKSRTWDGSNDSRCFVEDVLE